jgi:hypothetical protein
MNGTEVAMLNIIPAPARGFHTVRSGGGSGENRQTQAGAAPDKLATPPRSTEREGNNDRIRERKNKE